MRTAARNSAHAAEATAASVLPPFAIELFVSAVLPEPQQPCHRAWERAFPRVLSFGNTHTFLFSFFFCSLTREYFLFKKWGLVFVAAPTPLCKTSISQALDVSDDVVTRTSAPISENVFHRGARGFCAARLPAARCDAEDRRILSAEPAGCGPR